MAPWDASDHVCFARPTQPDPPADPIDPVPAIFVYSNTGADGHSTYHTPGDEVAGISPVDLQASLELMWALLEPLALGHEGTYLH
jgi:hypothetical protein